MADCGTSLREQAEPRAAPQRQPRWSFAQTAYRTRSSILSLLAGSRLRRQHRRRRGCLYYGAPPPLEDPLRCHSRIRCPTTASRSRSRGRSDRGCRSGRCRRDGHQVLGQAPPVQGRRSQAQARPVQAAGATGAGATTLGSGASFGWLKVSGAGSGFGAGGPARLGLRLGLRRRNRLRRLRRRRRSRGRRRRGGRRRSRRCCRRFGLVVVVVGLVVVVVGVVVVVVVGQTATGTSASGTGSTAGKQSAVGTGGLRDSAALQEPEAQACPGCNAGGATGTLLITGPGWSGHSARPGRLAGGDTTAIGNATGSGACGTAGR